MQIQNYIINNAPQTDRNHWNDLMHSERLGILISERLVNIPNGLVPKLHESIFEEVCCKEIRISTIFILIF